MIGKSVSHYRILEKLEGGGMGVIFKAEDVKLSRAVALKFLPAQFSDDEEAKERFIHEAKAASALDHPNICTIYEIGETDDGQLFIAMAFYAGETLAEKIARGPLPIAEAVSYVEQVAAGLAKSHEREIIHRDIKPGNIFVTADGQVKILDFGLAKVLGDAVTLSGLTQGTPAYMAPERIRDNHADARIDLWSLGVVLYEALGGERPFRGGSVPATIQAVYGEEPRDLRALRPEVPPGLVAIVDKLLAKDAAARYQTCDELFHDLRELDGTHASLSGTLFPRPTSALPRPVGSGAFAGARWRRRASALAALVLALAAAFFWLARARDPESGGAPDAESPTLAVLFFDNLSGDPELDWLRTGITELLVTDLSQSSHIRVLSTSQLHRLLTDLGTPEAPVSSADVLQRLTERAGVDQVLLGSVVKSGDVLRINVKLQDAASGRILSSRHVDGRGEDHLLSMVDDLSLGIRQRLHLSETVGRDPDLEVGRLSTSSIEAWRFYSEGMRLHLSFKEAAAAALFEKAVELDPDFSMAWAKLAVTSRNLDRPEAVDHAARALLDAERLPARERDYIEGIYASHDVRTWTRSREAFDRALAHDPDHHAARQNLVMLYLMVEDYDRAETQAQEQIRRGSTNLGAYATLAEAYAGRDDFATAEALLQDLVRRRSEEFVGHCALGRLYERWGRLDEALASFRRAEELQPGTVLNLVGLCTTHLLREDWPAALELAERHGRLQEPAVRVAAGLCRMLVALHRGQSSEALAVAEHLIAAIPRDRLRAPVRIRAIRALLARGDAAAALEQAELVRREGRGDLLEVEGLFLAGRAELELGRVAAASGRAEELRELAARIPGPPGERRYRHLGALVALAEGRLDDAVAELEAAAAMLPLRGLRLGVHEPDHVPLWASLAAAYRAAGRTDRAVETLIRIVDATEERVVHPVDYVRSLYLLGEIYRGEGERALAGSYFERFLAHWRDGDLERDWVLRAGRDHIN